MRKEKYKNLEERINNYFMLCDSANEEKGKIVKPYTLSGLLCHIEMTRAEFERMSMIKRHEKILSRAKSKIEAFIEENALTNGLSCNASLNSLKFNFGWGEKTDKAENETHSHITVTLSPEMSELAV